MNLNEACKLAKNIENYKVILTSLLRQDTYLFEVKETHLKKKTNPDVEDEIINPYENAECYDITVSQIIDILDKLTLQKAKLSKIIEDAKHNITVDVSGEVLSLDCATEYNKSLRNQIYSISHLNKQKNTKTKTTGKDYKFDNELKQTAYIYQVEVEKNLRYDTTEIKNKEKSLRKLADTISVEIEKKKIESDIVFDSEIELNDTFEDIIEKLR